MVDAQKEIYCVPRSVPGELSNFHFVSSVLLSYGRGGAPDSFMLNESASVLLLVICTHSSP